MPLNGTAREFMDLYEILQISPNAEPDTIHRVYRILAMRYHPDNPQTGDIDKFQCLTEAHHVLSDPEQRARYDEQYRAARSAPLPVFQGKEFLVGVEAQSMQRIGALTLLYNQRRHNPESPALSLLDLEALMAIPREHLMFTVWYLKAKHYIESNDSSHLTITEAGVDYVEENADSHPSLQKLIEPGSNGAE